MPGDETSGENAAASAQDGFFLNAVAKATPRPAARIATSATVPDPATGGIDDSPVRIDAIPVAPSARTKGSEVMVNVFMTAARPFPPFHGLLIEDHTPATTRMTAKITATTGL